MELEQFTLRQWRERRGLSQEQLESLCRETDTAKRHNIELTQPTISKIEIAGPGKSKWMFIRILAEALEIDPRQLRFDTGSSEKQSRLPLKRKTA